MTTKDIQTLLPELNDNQWKLLERAILSCLPKKERDYSKDNADPESLRMLTALANSHNELIDEITANIKQMMGQG